MCLYITSKLKKAQKDFYVFKEFWTPTHAIDTKTFVSPHMNVKQTLGELMIEPKFPHRRKVGGKLGGNCLHAYCLDHYQRMFSYILASQGILLAKVPKGSYYYLGGRYEIGVNQLILEELIVSGAHIEGFEVIPSRSHLYTILVKMLKGYNLVPS